MKTLINNKQEILNDIKHCISSFGLSVVDEINDKGNFVIVSQFKYEHYGFTIIAQYHPNGDLAEILIGYGIVPVDKIKPLSELMNYINSHVISGHFFVDPPTGMMSFRTAVHVADSLNKDEFEWALKQVMGVSYLFFPVLNEQMFTEGEPADIFNQYMKEEPQEVPS